MDILAEILLDFLKIHDGKELKSLGLYRTHCILMSS
jgi:hypothetical protein